MRKSNYLGFLFLLTLMVLSSCKKKVNYHYVNGQLLSAFNFKPGTYWIYIDSVTGREDSFVVTNYGDNYKNLTGIENTYNECIGIQILAYNIGILPNVYDGISIEYTYMNNEFQLVYFDANAKSGLVWSPLFNFPYQSVIESSSFGPYFDSNTDDGLIGDICKTYTLRNNTYSNVEFIYHSCAHRYIDTFYVSPNIGFIEMVFNHPSDKKYEVWQLERYKIIK